MIECEGERALHPLTGPLEKLRRAEVHFRALDREISEFQRTSKNEIVVGEIEPDSEYYTLLARVPALPPTSWGAAIGDIAHNLRSALDGLMWQLIIVNGINPETLKRPLPAFPIFREFKSPTGSGWWNEGRKQVERLQDKPAKFIEAIQPYHHPKSPDQSPLWVLHEINNADKHRLIPVAGIFDAPLVGIAGGGEAFTRLIAAGTDFTSRNPFLVDDARVGRVHQRVLAEGIPQYFPITDIAFQDGIARGSPVLRGLALLWNFVSEVLRQSRSSFPSIPPYLTDGLTAGIAPGVPRPPGSKDYNDSWQGCYGAAARQRSQAADT